MSWEHGEEHLVQEPAAARMETFGWKSILAFNEEDFGPNSLLGRDDKPQTVLLRSLRRALRAINAPWITEPQIEEAIAKLPAGELLGVKLQDHLVIGSPTSANGLGYVSMRDSGLVDDLCSPGG